MSASELSQEEIDALLNRATERAQKASERMSAARQVPARHAARPAPSGQGSDLGDLLDVPVEVKVRLGEAELRIDEIASLGEGAVVPLDRAPGDPVDVLVNGRVFARGELVAVDDRLKVRITEIMDAGAGEGGAR